MIRCLFVFLDGVGLAPASDTNPLSTLSLPTLRALAGDQNWTAEAEPVRQRQHVFVPLDATLGMDGLPQSGTGQVALFAGVDGPALHGRHFGPYPPSTTHGPLAEHSIYQRLKERGIGVDAMTLANGYPERYFKLMESRNRWNTSSRMARSAGVRLRTSEDITSGNALPADFTGHAWKEHIDDSHEIITPEAAGEMLLALARQHRFTLYDFPHTDTAGHGRNGAAPEAILPAVDSFLGAICAGLNPERDLLVISSDHGNIEDPTTKSHTVNPVPLIALGPGAEVFSECDSLLDVAPALVRALTPGG